MNARVFANTSTLSLTTGLDGGQFVPPTIPAGSEIYLRVKLSEDIEDTSVLDPRAINSAVARIGWRDATPTQGTYQLQVSLGGTDATTGDIDFDATDAEVKAAIDAALTTAGLTTLEPCTVTTYLDGQRIVFEDETEQPTITCTDNALWPMSFVDVDEISFDAGYAYVLQLRQTPVAESTTIATVVPSGPTITELQEGSTTDGVALNEVQKLSIPPSFSGGSFRIVRGGLKTDPISVPVENLALIATRLATLADTDGSFAVSQVRDGVYIEFKGSMGGEAQDLLTVEVFEAPPSDGLIRIDTDTDEMRTLMRGADSDGEIEVPFNLLLEVEDGVTEGQYQDLNFSLTLTFVKPIADDAHNVAASLVWNQPRSKADYLRHSSDSLLIGNRAVSVVIGDGVATSFVINHNLVENAQTFTVDSGTDVFTAASHNYQDNDPVILSTSDTLPDPLSTTATYYVISATTNTFQLATAPNGSAVDLTDTGTGTHTATLKDGTVNNVSVEVWETGGSEERVPTNAYTVARTSNNSVTVSGFATTPTSGEYEVLIQTYGRPATYQEHEHEIDETPEAKTRIEALEARVTALEDSSGSGTYSSRDVDYGSTIAQDVMKPIVEIFPLRTPFELPATGDLTAIDFSALPSRAGGLLPAVHDTTAEILSPVLSGGKLPKAADVYLDRVFTNDSGATITIPGGGGRRSTKLKAGEALACSGAVADGGVWYKVSRFEADHAGVTFTADATEDTITLGTEDDLKVGDVIQLTTTTTLPAGLSLATDYWILDDFQLATTATGAAVNITDTGTGTHTATRQAESTWYPVDFDRVLYVKHLNDRMFPRRSEFRMDFGLEFALLNAETTMQWVIVVEEGTYPEDATTTPTGANIGDPVWNTANPVLEQRIIIGRDMSTHTFGFKVTRTVVSNADVFTAKSIYYGSEVATRAPSSSDVSYRVRMVRADTEDSVAEPKGFLAVAGMAPSTAAFTNITAAFGLATVSR